MDPMDIYGFCDLNVDYTCNHKLLEQILKYNYRVIALNYTIDESAQEIIPSKKNTKDVQHSEELPVPEKISTKLNDMILKSRKKLKILNRITVIYSNPEQLRRILSSKNLMKYDIFAVLPKTQSAFQHACGLNNVDIISFEVGVTEYKPIRKLYKQVVDRGGFFEIQYSQALQSSVKRQETITMAQLFHIYGKSKNVIITSGASNVLEMRNPYDVANLGLLFGLSEEQAKYSLSHNCRKLILNAYGRKIGRTAITVELIKQDEYEPTRKRKK